MRQLNALSLARKYDRVVADDAAATKRSKSNVARPARPGMAIANPNGVVGKRYLRPDAAASPSIKAVPEGASTFIR